MSWIQLDAKTLGNLRHEYKPNGVRKGYLVAYPSLRRIIRSSLERLRSANQRKKLGDKSLFSFFTSTTVTGLTNGATLAP